jgi:hypothetical protein
MAFTPDFQQIADDLNGGCKASMLNHFGNGNICMPWTRHDVQIGVDWCYAKKTTLDKAMCPHCQNVFFKLYSQMVKKYQRCQRCEQEAVLKLSEKGFKYQNDAIVALVIQQIQCTCTNSTPKFIHQD